MRKFFSYFNALTGEREISNTAKFNMFFNQVRTQGDEMILPEISQAIAKLNQNLTDIGYLCQELNILPQPLPDLDFILKESDFLFTGLQNIQLAIFNEPLEMLSPSIRLENKSLCKILKLLKSSLTNFSCNLLSLEKKINIGQISRLLSIMESSTIALIQKIDEILSIY